MKNVLLISNKLFHYRVPVYNYFKEQFNKEGYEFSVLATESQAKYDHQFKFDCIVEKPGIIKYKEEIERINPAAVIIFMHMKDWIIWPLIHWLKLKKIPVVYWNYGVNLADAKNIYKNALYYHLHNISDAIVLYSPSEKKHIKPKNHHKVYFGYNTLNTNEFPIIEEDKKTLKEEFNIDYEKVVIYAARNDKDRKLDWLFEVFEDLKGSDKGLLIIGKKELTAEQKQVVDHNPNIMFLGEIYDQLSFNKLVKLSDVFSIPGRSGLAINQALYWGVPFVTTNVRQSPEIWYLKDGYNGYIADKNSISDYRTKLLRLLDNEAQRQEFSANAKKTMENEGNISNMFKGFLDAVRYASPAKIKLNKV